MSHIATTKRKAINWAKRQGSDYGEGHWWWAIYDEELDREDSWFRAETLLFMTKFGEIVENQPLEPPKRNK